MDNKYRLLGAIDALTEVDFDPWLIANNTGIGITSDRSLEFVVLDGNEPVGLAFTANDGNTFEFDVAVVSTHQGEGIGSALVDACIDMYDSENFDNDLTLETYVVNPAMRHILSKKGFEVSRIGGDSVYMVKPQELPDTTRLYHVTSADFDEFDLSYTKGQLGLHVGTLDQIQGIAEEFLDDEEDVFIFELDLDTSNPSQIVRLTDEGAWDSLAAVNCASKMLGVEMKLSGGENAIKKALSGKGVSIVRYLNSFEGDGARDSFILLDTSHIKAKAKHKIESEDELEAFVESRLDKEPILEANKNRFDVALKDALTKSVQKEDNQSSNKISRPSLSL